MRIEDYALLGDLESAALLGLIQAAQAITYATRGSRVRATVAGTAASSHG